jgi:hypothetical protein
MAQQGKGSLIRVVALVAVLIVVGAGFLYMRQAQGSLNSVQKIEDYVNGGRLVGKSLDDAKAALNHENPKPKEGEQNVFLFDMTEKDPKLAVVVEVVVRNNVIAANRTYDLEGRQTGTRGATDDG